MKFLLAIALAFPFLVGCASIPLADSEINIQAKQFPKNPNGAYVYIYRNEFMGAAVTMDVLLDNELLGATRSKNFLWVDVPAGDHTITSKAENDDVIQLHVETGRNYYVWQEVKMGILYARTKLHVVTESTGQEGVNECTLIAHQQPNHHAMR
ncbi:MAG TPA: DUF2846 domain-containing protein [Bdellovibrio sp.]|uniref:DUF2846 domain-containing protein n=1 Tax=Bdellovibrio sp. TaxID=28201 RepID=UPI002F2178F1